MRSSIKYIELVDQIGTGGTAGVYRGVDTHTGKLVAVKVLWKNMFKSEMLKNKFVEEANRYLYLEHPNIVKLRDFIIMDDAYYLVMEYVDGQNLDDYIRKVTGPIPEEVAAGIIEEVLAAIGYAHSQGVIHLDIKPANIMISNDGDIKVLDFGIASDIDKVKQGSIMGSPMYMSPEQVEGAKVDHRTDVYALGVTLFQMLAGKVPYRSNLSRTELFEHIKTQPLPRLKNMVHWASETAQKIIDKATAKKPNTRFQSCEEFANQIRTL